MTPEEEAKAAALVVARWAAAGWSRPEIKLFFVELSDELEAVYVDNYRPVGRPVEPDPGVSVEFTSTHVTVANPGLRTVDVILGGDVRDGQVELDGGESTTRKITGEGHGFVTVIVDSGEVMRYDLPPKGE